MPDNFVTLDITVREADSGPNGYYLAVSSLGCFIGTSPDEALGYAIREAWISGVFDRPVKLNIVRKEREE